MSTGAAPEAFIPLNGSAGNSAPVGGKRGSRKLKLVTRKQARKILKKMGRKMRGGQPDDAAAVVAVDPKKETSTGMAVGGKKTKRHGRKSRRSLFGLKY
jgi:hypothetical protein